MPESTHVSILHSDCPAIVQETITIINLVNRGKLSESDGIDEIAQIIARASVV